jgi:hypothetical protein
MKKWLYRLFYCLLSLIETWKFLLFKFTPCWCFVYLETWVWIKAESPCASSIGFRTFPVHYSKCSATYSSYLQIPWYFVCFSFKVPLKYPTGRSWILVLYFKCLHRGFKSLFLTNGGGFCARGTENLIGFKYVAIYWETGESLFFIHYLKRVAAIGCPIISFCIVSNNSPASNVSRLGWNYRFNSNASFCIVQPELVCLTHTFSRVLRVSQINFFHPPANQQQSFFVLNAQF